MSPTGNAPSESNLHPVGALEGTVQEGREPYILTHKRSAYYPFLLSNHDKFDQKGGILRILRKFSVPGFPI